MRNVTGPTKAKITGRCTRTAVILCMCMALFAGADTFYVAPDGADTNPGTIEEPFETISHAADTMKAGDHCYIREGIYYETLRPGASGTSQSPITFEAYQNETVVISAAQKLTGWEQYEGNIYRTQMDWDLGPGFNQLYVESEMMIEARHPNLYQEYDTATMCEYIEYGCPQGPYGYPNKDLPRQLAVPVLWEFDFGGPECDDLGWARYGYCKDLWIEFAPDDELYGDGTHYPLPDGIKGQPEDYFEGATVWKVGYFVNESGYIESSKEDGDKVHMEVWGGQWRGTTKGGYISGKRSLLDTEKEWVLEDGYAYLWAQDGADPNSMYVSAKRRPIVIDLDQREYVHIKKIHGIGGSISMDSATGCEIREAHFKYLTHYIYKFDRSHEYVKYDFDTLTEKKGWGVGVYVSGSENVISRSSFAYSAGEMMRLDGEYNEVNNCDIYAMGYSEIGSVCISGGHCTVQQTSLHDASRQCISFSGKKPGYQTLKLCDIYNGMLFTKDGALYYSYGPHGNNSNISYNWWRNCYARGPATYIYFDGGGGENVHIHHNVFFPHRQTGSRFITLATPYREWRIYNNTFAFIGHDHGEDLYASQTFEEWQDQTHQEKNDVAVNNLDVYTDTELWKFVDTAAGNYRLQEGSAAIDSGKVVSEIEPVDYVGDSPDLGAYEYGDDDWTPGHTWEYSWPLMSNIDNSNDVGRLRDDVGAVSLSTLSLRGDMVYFHPKGTGTALHVRYFNARGACAAEFTKYSAGTYTLRRPLLPSGVYCVSISAGRRRFYRKFVHTNAGYNRN